MPVYDAAGNMIYTPMPGDETVGLTCTYDAWNRLVSVTGNSGAINVSYTYDGLGRLVTRTDNVAGTTTVYYYAGQQLLQSEQYSPSPTGGGAGGEGSFADGTTCTTEQYVWSARYVDSPIETRHHGLDLQHGRRRFVERRSA